MPNTGVLLYPAALILAYDSSDETAVQGVLPAVPENTMKHMRQLQVIMFLIGAVSLIASAFGLGPDFGETLFKAGIAILLVDVVCIQLWPSATHP